MNKLRHRLVIFSGVSHHKTISGVVAHRGFVREVDIWAHIFEQVLVVTRLGDGQMLSDDVAYAEKNICFFFLLSPGNTDGLIGKTRLFLYAPLWLWHGFNLLMPQDIIMARGPDSIGFLGWLVSRLKRLPRFAKYADQWDNFLGEPLGYRLQKLFYRSRCFGGPVMIYGASDNHHPNWVPFFTSGISLEEWMQAARLISRRSNYPPFRLLFVGRLVYFKGIDVMLEALTLLNRGRKDIILDVVGDGPERINITLLVKKNNLNNVNFHGWLGPQELAKRYANAHIFIHPSRKEGFGKVLIEAMSYSLPIVGADVGVSRELVARNSCGLLFKNGDPIELARRVETLLSSSDLMTKFAQNGRTISREMLLEDLEDRYREFVKVHLGLPL